MVTQVNISIYTRHNLYSIIVMYLYACMLSSVHAPTRLLAPKYDSPQKWLFNQTLAFNFIFPFEPYLQLSTAFNIPNSGDCLCTKPKQTGP